MGHIYISRLLVVAAAVTFTNSNLHQIQFWDRGSEWEMSISLFALRWMVAVTTRLFLF